MRDQQREIYISDPALFRESNAAYVVVVNQIRCEEQRGHDHSRDHAHLVSPNVSLLDEIKSGSNENRCRGVQDGIDVSQIGDADHKSFRASAASFANSLSSVPL